MHINIEDTVRGMKQQFLSNFDRVICLDKKLRGHYCFTLFFCVFRLKAETKWSKCYYAYMEAGNKHYLSAIKTVTCLIRFIYL